jgi:hypothetical protein
LPSDAGGTLAGNGPDEPKKKRTSASVSKRGRELLSVSDLDQRTQVARAAREALTSIRKNAEAWIAEKRKENAVMGQALLTSLRLRLQRKEPISNEERTLIAACSTVENTWNRTCDAILGRQDHAESGPTIEEAVERLRAEKARKNAEDAS